MTVQRHCCNNPHSSSPQTRTPWSPRSSTTATRVLDSAAFIDNLRVTSGPRGRVPLNRDRIPFEGPDGIDPARDNIRDSAGASNCTEVQHHLRGSGWSADPMQPVHPQ